MTLPTFRSGLRALFNGVQAYFDAFNVTAQVAVGWKAYKGQLNQGAGRANRVVLVPSDLSGNAGKIGQPVERGERRIYSADDEEQTHPLATTRAIADWERVITLAVWAYDGTAPNDELRQVEAAEELLELAKRAVDATGGAAIAWGAVRCLPTERQFGAELLVSLTFAQPLYDVPLEHAYPGLRITKKDAEDES